MHALLGTWIAEISGLNFLHIPLKKAPNLMVSDEGCTEPVALAKANTECHCKVGDISISGVLSELENVYFLKEKH